MIKPLSYIDEEARIAALLRYRDLDYSDATEFQTITELAADLCNVPIALISFVDTSDVILHFVSGLEGASCIPRNISFCHYTVKGAEPFEIEDASLDSRFKSNPLVTDDPKFRFYTGMPIVTHDGLSIGAICVLDYKPNKLDTLQIRSLIRLS